VNTVLAVVTALSTLMALVSGAIAWRAWRDNAQRAEARVAALSADIFGAGGIPAARAAGADAAFELSRGWLLAAGSGTLLLLASLTVIMLRIGTADHQAATAAGPPNSAPSRVPAAPQALELVALSHASTRDGLFISGRIHNPAGAAAQRDLSVVVLAFDDRGVFLGTGQADAADPLLESGATATFAVNVPVRGAASRFRISFRRGDTVVPHIDRRDDRKNAPAPATPAPDDRAVERVGP
jgi:hypothetical protein